MYVAIRQSVVLFAVAGYVALVTPWPPIVLRLVPVRSQQRPQRPSREMAAIMGTTCRRVSSAYSRQATHKHQAEAFYDPASFPQLAIVGTAMNRAITNGENLHTRIHSELLST